MAVGTKGSGWRCLPSARLASAMIPCRRRLETQLDGAGLVANSPQRLCMTPVKQAKQGNTHAGSLVTAQARCILQPADMARRRL